MKKLLLARLTGINGTVLGKMALWSIAHSTPPVGGQPSGKEKQGQGCGERKGDGDDEGKITETQPPGAL